MIHNQLQLQAQAYVGLMETLSDLYLQKWPGIWQILLFLMTAGI